MASTTRAFKSIPEGLRIAVYNAMGGWGPFTVAQIDELFRVYGFTETAEVDDVGGARRTAAESFQRRIDWGDPEQQRRYLMLVEDVLENYPDIDGKPDDMARRVRRALKLANARLSDDGNPTTETFDDLWSAGTVRVFISHLAERRVEVHELAKVLRAIGFACFVAHDAIQPSRAWLREIERALRSCEVLVAYVSPGFASSDWTDQEVGWTLGRDLPVVPISVAGEMPRGFLGTYQAVRRHESQGAMSLAREVSKAIVDAVFEGQRPAAPAVRDRVAMLLVDAFCRVRSYDSARFWYQLLARIPKSAWTDAMRAAVESALNENNQLRDAVLDDKAGTPVSEATRKLIGR
jgi:signal recognition particle subunit SEC65